MLVCSGRQGEGRAPGELDNLSKGVEHHVPSEAMVEISNWCQRALAKGQVIKVEVGEGGALSAAVEADGRKHAVGEVLNELGIVVEHRLQLFAVMRVE